MYKQRYICEIDYNYWLSSFFLHNAWLYYILELNKILISRWMKVSVRHIGKVGFFKKELGIEIKIRGFGAFRRWGLFEDTNWLGWTKQVYWLKGKWCKLQSNNTRFLSIHFIRLVVLDANFQSHPATSQNWEWQFIDIWMKMIQILWGRIWMVCFLKCLGLHLTEFLEKNTYWLGNIPE